MVETLVTALTKLNLARDLVTQVNSDLHYSSLREALDIILDSIEKTSKDLKAL
jgi:hypothetical protein